jgi:hypothetical protein
LYFLFYKTFSGHGKVCISQTTQKSFGFSICFVSKRMKRKIFHQSDTWPVTSESHGDPHAKVAPIAMVNKFILVAKIWFCTDQLPKCWLKYNRGACFHVFTGFWDKGLLVVRFLMARHLQLLIVCRGGFKVGASRRPGTFSVH